MKRCLLLLGAGPLQLPAIHAAHRLGLEVVALDGNPGAPGLRLADVGRVVDLLDVDACVAVGRDVRPDGVIHICSEVAMPALGAINQDLALHGPDAVTVVRATNKEAMRRAFTTGNAPSPRSLGVRSLPEAVAAGVQLGGAVILKPGRNSGSRGVTRVDNGEDEQAIARAFRRALRESRDPVVVIEEFVDGPEFSVEILVWGRQAHVLAVTDKQTTGEPNFVETGHSQPSQLAPADRVRVVEAALRGVEALGLDWCGVHAEVRLSPQGPLLMEIGARLGGDFIASELVPRATGVDMVTAAIQLALGEIPDLTPQHPPHGACIRYLTPQPGTVIGLEGVDEARATPGVKIVELSIGLGDRVPALMSSSARVGHIIAEGVTSQAAIAAAERARDLIRITPLSESEFKDATVF